MDLLGIKTSAKITFRSGVRNANSAQGIQIGLVVSQTLDIFQALSLAEEVVGDIEYVVGFIVRMNGVKDLCQDFMVEEHGTWSVSLGSDFIF